jgi:hypothetical protein
MEANKTKGGWTLAGSLILLLGFVLLAGGCESDAVAPQDQIPPPTEREAAQQAALVAAGIANAGPLILTYNGKLDLGVYPYTFPPGGDISGSVVLAYFDGGAEGVPSHWNDADYGRMWSVDDPETDAVEGVSIALELPGGLQPLFAVTFTLQGPIDRTADTAELFGDGTLSMGGSPTGWTITEADPVLISSLSNWPTGGLVTFVAGAIVLNVVYDGDHTANVYVGDAEDPTYTIDLDTVEVTRVE